MSHLFTPHWVWWAAGLLVAYWLLRPTKPIYYRDQKQSALPRFMESVVMSLRVGGVIHVQHEGSPRQLRLRKLPLPAGRDGIRLELPSGTGTEERESNVREALAVAGFTCFAPPILDRLWPAQERLLFVTDALTPIDAQRAAEASLAALGLEPDARYTIHMLGTPSISATRKYFATRSKPPAA